MPVRQFISIPIATFVGGTRAVVDFYVQLAEDHYIKVVNSGSEFDLQQMTRYQDREVKALHVRKEDYERFVQHSSKIAEIVAASTVNVGQKTAVLLRTADHMFTQLEAQGFEPTVFGNAMNVSKSAIAIVEKEPELAELLDELSRYSEDFVRHCIATSVLATMMVQALKWHGKTMALASLGGLLHDVGMRDVPRNILFKPREQMTGDEALKYEHHPMRGHNLLKEIEAVPSEVLDIVLEHHELPNGAGFPRGLKAEKIFPLARAVSFADQLAELIVPSAQNPKPVGLREAIDLVSHRMRHLFPEIYFDAARKLLKAREIKKVA